MMEKQLLVAVKTVTLNYGIVSVTFSPDNKRLVSTSEDGTAKVWDMLG